jgi:chitin disaccharide deacetylase
MRSAAAMPSVILCADDFALSSAISETIVALARAKCLNAISCMAAMPGWPVDARLLDGIEAVQCGSLGRVRIGLHLVLSSERPLTPISCAEADGRLPGPDRLLAHSVLGRINAREFKAEIEAQFAAFRAATGRAPDFVDAHQHVHVYPVLRRLVISAITSSAPDVWVRDPSDVLSAMLARPFAGKAIGSSLRSLGFKAALAKAGLPSNASFAGHYDFGRRYAEMLPTFFRSRAKTHLIMCHPGSGHLVGDPIASARIDEARVIGEISLEERIARCC